jgi:hypothetical protein
MKIIIPAVFAVFVMHASENISPNGDYLALLLQQQKKIKGTIEKYEVDLSRAQATLQRLQDKLEEQSDTLSAIRSNQAMLVVLKNQYVKLSDFICNMQKKVQLYEALQNMKKTGKTSQAIINQKRTELLELMHMHVQEKEEIDKLLKF